MTNIKKDIKGIPLFLYDMLQVSLCALKDYWLKFKVTITKENYIGRYVGIISSSERRLSFEKCIAGGYTGYVLIKLFSNPDCDDYEECAEEILNHEILHQVLDKVVGHEAKMGLDNIHKSFYVLDCNENKWRFVIKFVSKKKGNVAII